MERIKNSDLDKYYNKNTNRIELNGDFEIDYISTSKNLYCKGDLCCEGDLCCKGNLYCKGDLCCEGDLCCKGNLYCEGDLCCEGDLYCKGNLYCKGDLCCEGDLCCKGNLYCEGDLCCEGNLKIKNKLIKKYLRIGKIGSRNSDTIFYIPKRGKVFIKCGCWSGNIDDFKKRVKDQYNGSYYYDEYMATIDYVMAMSKLNPTK